MKLTATKSFRYANRALSPGVDFETKNDRDGKLLIAIRKAKLQRAPGVLPPPPPEVLKQAQQVTPPAATPLPAAAVDDMAGLRAEYERVIGKKPYHGWDAATLREKIAAHGERADHD